MDRFADSDESSDSAPPTSVLLVEKAGYEGWLEGLSETERTWVAATLPEWSAGKCVLIPSGDGGDVKSAAYCAKTLDEPLGAFEAGATLATALPKGKIYELEGVNETMLEFAELGWSLGAYSFDRYKKKNGKKNNEEEKKSDEDDASEEKKSSSSKLVLPTRRRGAVERAARATYLVRDLVTTPAEDMGPLELQEATEAVAKKYPGASVEAVVGDALLAQNYPQVHAVGRAASAGREPRVVKLRWHKAPSKKKTLVLVGKGVTFDTGGLNIKPNSGMLTMKKDMGGAAHALALAEMVMDAELDVNLVLLLGCVENSISGSAFRPGDVLRARDGTTTEIGNTDAEGRLVLADLLVEASEEVADCDLIIDVATLTGAGRVALGTDVPAMFSTSDDVAIDLQARSANVGDQVWRLPLWQGYAKELDSKVADLKNIGNGPYGGCITAALYLQKFVKHNINWLHFDLMAYNQRSSPGKPEGGEAMAIRAIFDFLKARYPSPSSLLPGE